MAEAVARRIKDAWSRAADGARAGFRRDPLFVVLFVALWICALVPLWAPRFLPLLDLPDHIDAIAMWHRYHQDAWGYSKYYDLNLLPLPYWGYFLPVNLLSYLMPVEIANKVYLSAYALCLPLATAVLARQMRRSHWLSFFAFPLVFNMNFSYGFITFCVGIVVLTFAVVVLDRYLEQPTERRAFALFALTLTLYFTHLLPWMFFGVASIVLVFCHGWHPRRILTAAGLELPSLFVALYGFHRAANGSTVVQTGKIAYEAKSEALINLLQEIPVRLIAGWPSNAPYWIVIGLSLTWLALLLTARSDVAAERADEAQERRGFPYRLELIALLAVAAYLFLPVHLFKPVDLWMIGGRFLTIVALFGALAARGPIVRHRRWLLVPVIVLSAYYPLALARNWVRFDRRAASFRRLMRRVERGSSTLVLVMGDGGDANVDPTALPYLQFHAYAQYLAGGYDPWSLPAGFPCTPKPGAALPAPRWKHPETFTFDADGIHYDYILTKNEWTDHAIFGPDDSGRAPLVAQDGEWRLYAVGQR